MNKILIIIISNLVLTTSANYYRLILIDNGRIASNFTNNNKKYSLILLKLKSNKLELLKKTQETRQLTMDLKDSNEWEIKQIVEKHCTIPIYKNTEKLVTIKKTELKENFFEAEEQIPIAEDMNIRRNQIIQEIEKFQKEELIYVIDRIKVFNPSNFGSGDLTGFKLRMEKNNLVFLDNIFYLVDFYFETSKYINIDFDVLPRLGGVQHSLGFNLKMKLEFYQENTDFDLNVLNKIQIKNSNKLASVYKMVSEDNEDNEENGDSKIILNFEGKELHKKTFKRKKKDFVFIL